MKTKIIIVGLSFIVFGSLNGCAIYSSPTSTEIEIQPHPPNYAASYRANPNDTDFHHDDLVGYGGVNVYDYNHF